MQETSSMKARLRAAVTLPDILAVSFDAFEAIRLLARDGEDQVPGLFAAFMTAADAAVDGREALTLAPSPPGPAAAMPRSVCPQPTLTWPRSLVPWPGWERC
jgi:hypothetical protein